MPGDADQITKASGCVAGDRRLGRNSVAASEVTIIAAPGLKKRLTIKSLIVGNTNATAGIMNIRDGTAGTIKVSLAISANMPSTGIEIDPPLTLSENAALTAQGTTAMAAEVVASGWVENA